MIDPVFDYCHVHDSDDIGPDRICGRRLPCPEHRYVDGWHEPQYTNLPLSPQTLSLLDGLARHFKKSREDIVKIALEFYFQKGI